MACWIFMNDESWCYQHFIKEVYYYQCSYCLSVAPFKAILEYQDTVEAQGWGTLLWIFQSFPRTFSCVLESFSHQQVPTAGICLSTLGIYRKIYSCLSFVPYLSFSFCIDLPKPFPIITWQHVFPISFYISPVICSSLKFPHHDPLGFSGFYDYSMQCTRFEDLEVGTIEPWKRTCSVNLSNSGLFHSIWPFLLPPILM